MILLSSIDIECDFAGNGGGVLSLYATQRPLGIFVLMLGSLASFRLLKMTRYLLGTKVLIATLTKSLTSLIIPSYLLLLLLTFFGTLVFAVEYEPDQPELGRLPDVTSSWWMLLTTMTTVGYGDFTPQTCAGKILTGIAMLAGLLVISMPLAIVGDNFSEAWESRTVSLISERIRQKILIMGLMKNFSMRPELNAYRIFDRNGLGHFNYRTFKKVLREDLGLNLANWRLRKAWKVLDLDEDDMVDFYEFASAIYPEVRTRNCQCTCPFVTFTSPLILSPVKPLARSSMRTTLSRQWWSFSLISKAMLRRGTQTTS